MAAQELADEKPGRTLVITHFDVHRYDERKHSTFVYLSFAKSLRRPRRDLARALRRPGTLVLIASPLDDPRTFLGWLACRPAENRIVCAYVKELYRAPVEQRLGLPIPEGVDCFRIASSLAIAAGVDFQRSVPCTFWSRAARKIAAKAGNPYNLSHAPEEDR